MSASRLPESSFSQQLERALKQAHAGGPVDIPRPKTREDLLVTLDALQRELSHFNGLLDQALGPNEAPAVDLSAMSLEQKLEAGERACVQLQHAALAVPEQRRLNALEPGLAHDQPSKQAAAALLARVRG